MDNVCCNIRNVKFMQFKQMFATDVCILFLLKLKWPKSKNFFETTRDQLSQVMHNWKIIGPNMFVPVNLVPRAFSLA